MRTVIITDKNDVNCGKEFPGQLEFYDVYYRGGTGLPVEDLYFVTIDGKEHRYVSSQIDVKHYKAQELKDEIERLGANVGDKVRIIETGSGGWRPAFMKEEFHIITDIKSYGDVVFDDGAAYMFRPVVEKI